MKANAMQRIMLAKKRQANFKVLRDFNQLCADLRKAGVLPPLPRPTLQ